MGYYVASRFVHGLLLLLAVSIFSFALLQIAPGSYFDELRANPSVSSDTIAVLNARYGLDQPMAVRYGRWLRGALRGDLGLSLEYNVPVKTLLAARVKNTLALTIVATLLAWLIAIPIGMWSSGNRRVLAAYAVDSATSGLLVVPDMVIALAFVFIALRTHILPVGGMTSAGFEDLSAWNKVKDLCLHLLLPVLALACGMLPVLVRHVRSSLAETLRSPFIDTARSFGIPRPMLLFRYALPAAANPLISLFGLSLAGLLSGSMLVEVIMGWPGMGPLLLEAILARDVYIIIGAVMLSAALVIVASFLADVLLYV